MLENILGAKARAPEFEGISAWINTKPLSMEKLRGKVVLIDFWTYTCINCLRTLPYIKKWHEKYSKKGLVIVGVHTPEFRFEADPENVKAAVKELGIKYPVALDADMQTWEAFDNHYWPAKFLIDKEGFVSYVHFGEGGYEQTEKGIQKALGIKDKLEEEKPLGYMFDQSPESYAGFAKCVGLGSGLVCDQSGCSVYIDPGDHAMNTIYPNGQWVQEKEYIELKKAPGTIAYRFNARQVNIVMEPVQEPADAEIYIDGKKTGRITIDEPKTYTVFIGPKYGDRELSMVFFGNVRVYALTFG